MQCVHLFSKGEDCDRSSYVCSGVQGFTGLRVIHREILLETLPLFGLRVKIQSNGIEGAWRQKASPLVPWITTLASPNVS